MFASGIGLPIIESIRLFEVIAVLVAKASNFEVHEVYV
jgi:hypothetical protein